MKGDKFMNKEQINEKMKELSEKMKGLSDKAKDSVETAQIAGMYAKDKVDEKILEAKSSVNAMKENYRLFSERVKGKASSELIKAKMNMDVAKANLEEKKAAHDKAQMEAYIEETIEYASACVELSFLAAEEAKLATLEAIAAQDEYDEKYGSEETNKS